MASTRDRGRPLRADAERNRQRLIAAAQELFASKGLSVGLDEIARHAGVGVGTAYRRFPDKEQLIEALFEDHIGRIVSLAEEALGRDEPWAALVGFMEAAVELNATNRGVKELMFSGRQGTALVDNKARRRLVPLVQELVRRAQASGELRADVEVTDMPLIQFMVAGLADLGGRHAPAIWRRQLGIVLDGLRTPDPRPLAAPPIGLPAFVETVSRRSR
jgi:AcrR family transcriptional regulator